MCKVPGDLSRCASTHELSYVVRGNLEPGKRRRARGRDMDGLSGFPVGHPSWGDADSLPGSRGAEEQAKGLAERAEASRVLRKTPRTVRDREKYLFCFVFYYNYKEEKIKCNPLRWVKPSHRVKVGLRREGKIRKNKSR